MRSFWIRLWLAWAAGITLFSLFWGILLAAAVTMVLYGVKGMPPLNAEVGAALWEVGFFAFGPTWSIALSFGTLYVLRGVFGRCFGGHRLQLLDCEGHGVPSPLSLAAVTAVWRKWLFVTVWIVALLVVLVSGIGWAVSDEPMGWFDIYGLYLLFLLSGGVSLPMMGSRCKRVGVRPC